MRSASQSASFLTELIQPRRYSSLRSITTSPAQPSKLSYQRRRRVSDGIIGMHGNQRALNGQPDPLADARDSLLSATGLSSCVRTELDHDWLKRLIGTQHMGLSIVGSPSRVLEVPLWFE